jgi:predicted TIM-barrel fold metal-dependent hydrolase
VKQERVDLWSAASFAVAPAAVTGEHLAAGAPRHLSSRLVARLAGADRRDDGEAEAIEVLATTEGRLRAQDADGLAGEVLLPDPALLDALLATDDAGRQRAGLEAYNAWAGWLQAGASDRLVAVAQVPTTGLDDALDALRAAQAAGLRAVSLSQPPAGAGTAPADGEDFWRLAGDRTVVVLGPTYGGASFAERAAPHVAAGRPSGHVAMLTRLALTGIWDDVPDLRLLIAGVDAGWIPYVLEAADTNYLRTSASRPVDLRREDALPSDYVRRHVFATFGEDRFAALSTRYFGPHHLLWSAALPTTFSSWPNDEEQAARVTAGLPTEERRLLLGANCRRVFRLEGVEDFLEAELSDFDRAVLV